MRRQSERGNGVKRTTQHTQVNSATQKFSTRVRVFFLLLKMPLGERTISYWLQRD